MLVLVAFEYGAAVVIASLVEFVGIATVVGAAEVVFI